MGSVINTITGNDSFRNKVINGNFDVWQRGTSQTASDYGSDDRWSNGNAGSTKTHSRQSFTLGQTDVPGSPRYFSRTAVTSVAGASNVVIKQQRIESVAVLAGQTATLSFWAKADASKNIAVEFIQSFGTGGSPSAVVTGIGVTTIALTSGWKKFTVTVAIPSISGKTIGTAGDDFLGVLLWFDAGSSFNARTNSLGQQSGTFDIAQVQLEAGSNATPFEQRPIGLEISLCQRYYEKSFEINTAPSNGPSATAFSTELGVERIYTSGNTSLDGVTILFKVNKRSVPAVTLFGNNSGAWMTTNNTAYSHSVQAPSDKGFSIYQAVSTGIAAGRGHWTASAEL